MNKKTLYLWLFLVVMIIITAFTYNKRHTEKKEQIKANMVMEK